MWAGNPKAIWSLWIQMWIRFILMPRFQWLQVFQTPPSMHTHAHTHTNTPTVIGNSAYSGSPQMTPGAHTFVSFVVLHAACSYFPSWLYQLSVPVASNLSEGASLLTPFGASAQDWVSPRWKSSFPKLFPPFITSVHGGDSFPKPHKNLSVLFYWHISPLPHPCKET